jgi:hypothetical protein
MTDPRLFGALQLISIFNPFQTVVGRIGASGNDAAVIRITLDSTEKPNEFLQATVNEYVSPGVKLDTVYDKLVILLTRTTKLFVP